ncbi:MAG: hypothetical protein QME51_10590, partial [Planctomycetota bacterium]|nr:hypothetical protein [Planctomycetota bacterium]
GILHIKTKNASFIIQTVILSQKEDYLSRKISANHQIFVANYSNPYGFWMGRRRFPFLGDIAPFLIYQ